MVDGPFHGVMSVASAVDILLGQQGDLQGQKEADEGQAQSSLEWASPCFKLKGMQSHALGFVDSFQKDALSVWLGTLDFLYLLMYILPFLYNYSNI